MPGRRFTAKRRTGVGFDEKDVGSFAGAGRRRVGLGLPDPAAAQRPRRRGARRGRGRAGRLRSLRRQRRRRVRGRGDRRGLGGDDRRRVDAAAFPAVRRPGLRRPGLRRPPANARNGATTTTATASASRSTERTLIRRFAPAPGPGGLAPRIAQPHGAFVCPRRRVGLRANSGSNDPRQPARRPVRRVAQFRPRRRTSELPHPALYRHADGRGRARPARPIRPPRSRRIISSGRTAGSTSSSPRSARAWHAGKASGRARATSIPLRSGSRSSIPAMTAACRRSPTARSRRRSRLRATSARAGKFRPSGCSPIPTSRRGRKRDPGEAFPWAALMERRRRPLGRARAGRRRPLFRPEEEGPPVRALQAMLALYGYGVELTGVYDRRTRAVVDGLPAPFPARAGRRRSGRIHRRDAEGADRGAGVTQGKLARQAARRAASTSVTSALMLLP